MPMYQIASGVQFCSWPQLCHVMRNPNSYTCMTGKEEEKKHTLLSALSMCPFSSMSLPFF